MSMRLYRTPALSNICTSCLQVQKRRNVAASCLHESPTLRRSFSSASPLRDVSSKKDIAKSGESSQDDPKEEGAFSRKLAELAEDAILEGGKSAQKNIQEAGFSEELRIQLEERVKAAAFKSENAAAFSVVNMPSSAGQGTQDIAAASPWRGSESTHDASLRMLNDARKPIRVPFKVPQPTPVSVNLRPSPKPSKSTGQRLASARDGSNIYALSQSAGLSEDERAAVRKELRQRFEVGARSLPMTIQGLTSLANERIEDAISRGQFKNLPRGRGVNVQTDHNANSAFIDTTEYFMNKIIQKQEIVPPWIEKQQEIVREVDRFRQRLRGEWRRHAARLIASQGGPLPQQRTRAQAYAAAEARLSESKRVVASLSSPETDDTTPEPAFTQISHDGRISSGIQSTSLPSHTDSSTSQEEPATSPESSDSAISSENSLPHLPPLRDPDYLSIERAYHELQVKAINDLTRSYNLQAPRLAQKPYLNLERELNACFADVAPSLADEITRRATERAPSGPIIRKRGGGVLDDLLTSSQRARVYDEDRAKTYGLKELWRDLWGKREAGRHTG